MRYTTKSCLQSLKPFSSGETTLKVQLMSYWSSLTTRTLNISPPPSSSPDDKSGGRSTSLGSTTSSTIRQDALAPSQMPSHTGKMCTPEVTMCMHWLTPITSSRCSNLVNSFGPSSCTRQHSSSRSSRVLLLTLLPITIFDD